MLYEIDNAGNSDRPGSVQRTGEDREANICLSMGDKTTNQVPTNQVLYHKESIQSEAIVLVFKCAVGSYVPTGSYEQHCSILQQPSRLISPHLAIIDDDHQDTIQYL